MRWAQSKKDSIPAQFFSGLQANADRRKAILRRWPPSIRPRIPYISTKASSNMTSAPHTSTAPVELKDGGSLLIFKKIGF